jgi:hypothetical protein
MSNQETSLTNATLAIEQDTRLSKPRAWQFGWMLSQAQEFDRISQLFSSGSHSTHIWPPLRRQSAPQDAIREIRSLSIPFSSVGIFAFGNGSFPSQSGKWHRLNCVIHQLTIVISQFFRRPTMMVLFAWSGHFTLVLGWLLGCTHQQKASNPFDFIAHQSVVRHCPCLPLVLASKFVVAAFHPTHLNSIWDWDQLNRVHSHIDHFNGCSKHCRHSFSSRQSYLRPIQDWSELRPIHVCLPFIDHFLLPFIDRFHDSGEDWHCMAIIWECLQLESGKSVIDEIKQWMKCARISELCDKIREGSMNMWYQTTRHFLTMR